MGGYVLCNSVWISPVEFTVKALCYFDYCAHLITVDSIILTSFYMYLFTVANYCVLKDHCAY